MITTRDEYRRYLRSRTWKLRRHAKIARDAHWIAQDIGVLRCTCGAAVHRDDVQIHHLHYRTLGNESLDDLQIACERCHSEKDRARNEALPRV